MQAVGAGSYTLVWRHYKNACRGGHVGDGQVVKTTPDVTGDLWQSLFHEWVTWGRQMWLASANVDEYDVPYTFVDMGGDPFDSAENGGLNMSMWMRGTIIQVCTESEHFTPAELGHLQGYTVQVARFSYIQMMDKHLRRSQAQHAREIHDRKKDLCRLMLTSPAEWDTYANRRDHTEDMEETANWLRDAGFLV